MLQQDSAPLRVLYIGGTGTISASCVRLSVESGMRVAVLNRGRNGAERRLPEGVESIVGDITDAASLAVLADRTWDVVVHFLSYDADDALRMVDLFGGRTAQYVHISSGSIYAKPVQQLPITESTPVAPNVALEYAQAKLRAEEALLAAHRATGFPVDDRAALAHLRRRQPAAAGRVDGHRPDAPRGGDPGARRRHVALDPHPCGGLRAGTRRTARQPEDDRRRLQHHRERRLHLGPDLLDRRPPRFGVEAKLVHVASEMFPVVAPEWFWSGEMVGDIGHSADLRHDEDPDGRARLRPAAHLLARGHAHGRLAGRAPGLHGARHCRPTRCCRGSSSGYHAAADAFAALASVVR